MITAVILAGLGFGAFLFGTLGNDLDQLEQSGFKECEECDLSGADLTGADLSDANLMLADLEGVIGADFTDALFVPAEYRKN